MRLISLEWLLPRLGSVHDSSLVKVEVVKLFRVSELAHDEAVAQHVKSKEGHS